MKPKLKLLKLFNFLNRRERKRRESEKQRKTATYEKILRYMQESKPYLNPDFMIVDLSRAVYTNKSYVSLVINEYSGKNFCQFVNSYRIAYAVELMKADPRQPARIISAQSGFNTDVTFLMAFRINMGMTPGQYAKRLKG